MHQRKQDKEPGNHESLLQNQTSPEVAAVQSASWVSDLFPSQIPRFQGCQACPQWTKGYLTPHSGDKWPGEWFTLMPILRIIQAIGATLFFIEPSLYSRPSSSRVSCVNPVKNRLSVSTNRPVLQGVIQCCLSSLAHKSDLRKIAVSQSPRDLGFSWAAPSANPVFSTSC